jgi:hypothetical protein
MNFVGCAKVQTKNWNDAQTSENVQNLEFLLKNALISSNLPHRVAEVQFSLVQQGIFLNCKPEPNSRGTIGRTENWTCRTARFRFKLGLDWAEPSIFISVVKWWKMAQEGT